jgi:hypothetical protein
MQINYNHTPHAEESLPDVLMRIVTELHDVAYLIERIEPQLLADDSATLADAADKMMVLQGIDLAVQKTRGLAEFIDTITASIPDDWLVDISTAVNLVKVADMKKALARGVLRHRHSQPLTKVSGDFEAF